MQAPSFDYFIEPRDYNRPWTTAQLTVQVRFARPSAQPRGPQAATNTDTAPRTRTTLIGAHLVAFSSRLSAVQRSDILNAILLARAAALKAAHAVETASEARRWHDEFFDVLSNIGLLVERSSRSTHKMRSRDFSLADLVLSAAPRFVPSTAIAALQHALRTLQSLPADDPSIAIFNRDSRVGHLVRFQMTAIESDPSSMPQLFSMAFLIESKTPPENPLLSRFRSTDTKVELQTLKLIANLLALESGRDSISTRLEPLMDQLAPYQREIPDL